MLRVRRDVTLITRWPCATPSASCVTTKACVMTQTTTVARELTCCVVRVCSASTQRHAPGSWTETTGTDRKRDFSWVGVWTDLCVERKLHNKWSRLTLYFLQLCCSSGISPMRNLGGFPWGKPAVTELRYPTYSACWVFQCFLNPPNSDMDYRIFNEHTGVNACDCTQGCMDTLRESALKVDSGRKIPCGTGESSLTSVACQSDAISAELHPHPLEVQIKLPWSITYDGVFLHFAFFGAIEEPCFYSRLAHQVQVSILNCLYSC